MSQTATFPAMTLNRHWDRPTNTDRIEAAWGRFMEAALILEEVEPQERETQLALALNQAIAGISALRTAMER